MQLSDHVCLMASYNEWMNAKLYEAAGQLSSEELLLDRQAFFGSILETLNHIVVADIIWLKRFADHPTKHSELESIRSLSKPQSLDQILFDDFSELSKHRKVLDGVIINWANVLTDDDLNHVLHYTNTKGILGDKKFFNLLMHFFNHQTHHRGQVTTLLSQAGVAVGVTDLLSLI
jgi:uncharacterized damage-inducible protein DinB